MKVDNFKFIPTEVERFIKSLTSLGDAYKEEIKKLQSLVDEINTSTSWRDQVVKTEFIEACNSYITIYNDLIATIFSRIEYLKTKSGQATEIENLYKKV